MNSYYTPTKSQTSNSSTASPSIIGKAMKTSFLMALMLMLSMGKTWAVDYHKSTTATSAFNAGTTWGTTACAVGGLAWPTTSGDNAFIDCAAKATTPSATMACGNLTISAGTLTISSGTLTVNGNLLLNGGALVINGTGVLTVMGNLTFTSGTFTHTAGTVNLSGVAQNVGGAMTPSFFNLNVAGSGNKTLTGSVTVTGALTFTNNKLNIGANTLSVNGTVVTMTAAKCFVGSASSNLTFGGTVAVGTVFFDQTSAATRTISTWTSITGAATHTVTLGNKVEISTSCNTTTGVIILNSQELVLNGTYTGASTTNGCISSLVGTPGTLTIGGTGALGTLYFLNTTATLSALNINRASSGTLSIGGTSGTTAVTVTTLNMTAGQTTLVGNLVMAVAGTITGSTPSTTNMIVTSATSGYFTHTYASGASSKIYPVGEVVGTAEYNGFTINVASNTVANRTVGWKVVDAALTSPPTSYISRHWISRASSVANTFTWSTSLPYNGTTGDINGTESSMFAGYNTAATYAVTNTGTANTTTHALDITGGTATQLNATAMYFTGSEIACANPSGPQSFNVTAISNTSAPVTMAGNVGLQFNTGVTGVIIFANTSNVNAVPVDGVDYAVGDVLPSGSICIFKGGAPALGGASGSNYTSTWSYDASVTGGTDLSANTFYFFNTYSYAAGGTCNTNYSGTWGFASMAPGITAGAFPTVGSCAGAQTANFTYSSTTGSPDQYNIVWDALNSNAIAAGFVNVQSGATYTTGFTTLPASPISLAIPAGVAPGTYTGKMNVKNSTNGFTTLDNGGGSSNLQTVQVTVVANTGLSGTKTVGTGGDYLTFNGASGLFADINTNGLAGDLTVNVISDITEVSTTALNQVSYFCGGPYTITIQPDAATVRTVSGALTGSLIQFNGADNVTVDGNYSGVGRYLLFKNTNTTTGNVFYLNNDASFINIANCDIQGLPSNAANAVINIGTGTATGNNNIYIDNNLIHHIGTGSYPLQLIYSNGSAGFPNNTISITNNELYNFSSFGGGLGARRAYAVNVTATGNGSNWTITGNSVYNTFVDGTGFQTAISFLPGASSTTNTISDNWIGGKSANGGTANTPWQNSYDDFFSGENRGVGIIVNSGTTTIDGNNITNILWSNGDYSGFVCLHILGSTVATVTNNNFGSGTAGTPDNTKIIQVSGGGISFGSAPGYIYGIWNQSSTTSMTTYTGNNFYYLFQSGGCSSCTGGNVHGIAHQTAGPATITNNVINGAQGGGYTYNQYGFRVEPSASTSGNIIANNKVAGPYVNGAGAGAGVTNVGIYVRALGTNTVSGTIKENVVWDMRSNEVEGYTEGIYILANGGGNGNWNITNNQITLKNNGNTGVPVGLYGIEVDLNSASTTTVDYNSVYISGSNGGSPVNGADFSSYAFFRYPNQTGTVTGDAITLRNNIFINWRLVSNGFTTGHFAIANLGTNAATNWNVSDYNFLAVANGSKSYLGYWVNATNLALSNWQTASSKDAASYTGSYTAGASNFGSGLLNPDNLFNNPLSDLHISYADGGQSAMFVDARATPIAVTTDYDVAARDATTPDIGADEFILPSNIITTTTATYGPFCTNATGSISVAYTSYGTFAGTYYVQLSNSSGVFPAFTSSGASDIIGTGGGTSPISATVPSGLPAGTGYRLRVINDSPLTYGTDNGNNITVNTAPSTPVFTTPATATLNNLTPCLVANNYAITSQGGSFTYSWSVPGGWGAVSGGTTTTITVTPSLAAGNVTASVSVAGCVTESASLAVAPITVPAAPVANGNVTPQVTSVNTNDFTATWGAVSTATSYNIDVATTPTFLLAPATVSSDGFEGGTGQLNAFTVTAGVPGLFVSGNTGATDGPASSPQATGGTYAYSKSNGTVTITTGTINTSTYTSAQMSFKLASVSLGAATNGADNGDLVTVEVSADGTTFYPTVRVNGNANAYWAYSATGNASTAYDGNVTPVDFQPVGGGVRTTDGYSTVTVTNLPLTSTMKIRITMLNNAAAEKWVMDDFLVTAVANSMLAGYNNLLVSPFGTSLSVTGLTPATTYYYRVRATNACGTSGNSNAVEVTTITTATLTAGSLSSFGTRCFGSSTDLNFTLSGSGLDGTDATIGPLTGFEFSANGGAIGTTATYGGYAGNSFSVPITVRFLPTGSGLISFDGNIPISGCGATAITRSVTASGTDAPAQPTITAGNLSPCASTTGTYSVTNVAGISYAWTLPSGWSGTSTTNSISATAAASGSGTVTVTPSIGSCAGTAQTWSVNVTATPAAPVANGNVSPQTTGITTTSFGANWGAVSGASTYTLNVYTGGTTTNLSENFSGFVTNNGSTDQSASLNSFLQTTGWTGTAVYEMVGYSKLGSASVRGIITTPTLNLSGGTATLSFDLGQYGSDASIVQVFLNTGSGFTQFGADITAPASITTQTVNLTGLTATSTISIRAKNASTCRFYLDNVIITSSSYTLLTSYSGLTGTTQTVGSLTPNTAYYYDVTATNTCGTSSASNFVAVTTYSAPTLTAGSLATFGTRCFGSSTDLNFNLSGTGLDGTDVTIGPLSGFEFSANGGAFGTTATYGGYAGNSFTNIPITVRFLPTGSGTVSFNGNIPAVGGAASSINIAVTATGNDAPAQPTITAGNLTPCPSSVGTYSVANVAGVTYAWTLPAGWSGTSTTNSISATASATQGSSGTISVVPSIGSCAGTAQTWSETVTSLPSQPSVISTPGSPCAGSTGNVYSVTNVSGVTYTWAVSGTGWSIPSASTTNSVTITAGSAAGGITVTPYVNGCAGTARTLTGISVVSSYVPTVSIANSSTYVCINSSNTFTATRTDGNGGTAAYSWKVNGTQVSTSNPYTATAGTFTNGDAIRCDMTVTGSCAVPSTATSNTYFAQKLAYSPTQLWIEDFGTGTQSDVSSYTSATNTTFTFTTGGTPHPDVRTSTVSPGGGSNVFMGASGFLDRSFTISNINTVGAFPNKLSFYFYNPTTTVASPNFRLEYSTDGTNFYEVNYGTISAAGWSLVSVSNVLPQSSTVSLRFTSNLQGAVNIRIDDIKLESYTTGDAAVSASPTGPFCGSGSTTITATPTAASGLTYAWNNGSLFSPANPTINNPTTTTISSSGSVVTTNFTTTITDVFGCTSAATQTVVVNPVPNTYTVTGTGSYCSGGAGLNVGINSSQTAVNYQLYFNGTPQGSPVAGTGNPSQSLFGAQTAAGTYTIVATHSTGSCTATMTGSAVITVNPLPTAYTLSASATSYCLGGSGVTLDLSNSQTNTSYQLLVDGVNTGSPITGTGSSISFGNQIAAGTYTVTATNTSLTPNCSSTMTGSPAVTINPVASVQLGGSTAIFTQAFTSGLPSGWSINTPSGSTYDWAVTSATPSTGYTGASGGNHFTVATSAAGANSTTVSQLISQNYSISGYSNISVVWAARKTASYPGSGTFYYSTNNGSSWTQAAFIDVAGNSTWSLVNNGIAVSLPLSAGATTLKLRWDAQAVTTLSTYGVDDVSVYGLANTTTCTNLSSVAINYAASANSTGYTLTAGTAALASFVTQSGTLSSGGGTLTLVIPSGSAAGSYDFDLNLTNGASCNKTHSIPVVIAPTPSVTAVIDECAYISADKDIVLVTGSGGTTPITYTSSNIADLPLTSISNYLIPFEAPTDGLSRTFTATDASGCIASSGAVTTYNNHPTDIPYASATGTNTVDCYSKNLNRWLTFRDNANKAILSIKDNNQDLGLVTASVYREGAEPVILNSSNQSTNTGVGNCYLYPELAMKRHFAITTEKTFAQAVDVRLYFSDAELQSLITTSTVPPSNPSDGCAKGDDVHNINELYVTKYSGPNVDGLYTNNSAGNQGGIYRMFGANVTSPNTAFDVVSSAGFPSLFSGAPTHHYLQMHVTEFSEFWLHGSDEIYPLPVDMIYLEANAINNAYIQLTWATALEVNNDGFNIERSVDGQNWSQIAFVDGHDNSTIQNDYSYDDLNVTAGIRYYYRLKQVDNDGQFKYTDIVSAMLSGDITFSVKDFVPNPAGDKTTLLITATSAQELTVEIFDIIGQKVSSNVHTLNRGLNHLDFDVSYLASGTYSAVVYSGNATFTKKLVITK